MHQFPTSFTVGCVPEALTTSLITINKIRDGNKPARSKGVPEIERDRSIRD